MTRPKSIALDFDKTIFGGEFTSTDVVEGPPIVGAIEWLREQLWPSSPRRVMSTASACTSST